MLIFIAYSLLIGMVIYYADVYSKYEPSITQVNNKKESLSSKKVDESAINKLKELEARNISLESLFDNGRTNPFEN